MLRQSQKIDLRIQMISRLGKKICHMNKKLQILLKKHMKKVGVSHLCMVLKVSLQHQFIHQIHHLIFLIFVSKITTLKQAREQMFVSKSFLRLIITITICMSQLSKKKMINIEMIVKLYKISFDLMLKQIENRNLLTITKQEFNLLKEQQRRMKRKQSIQFIQSLMKEKKPSIQKKQKGYNIYPGNTDHNKPYITQYSSIQLNHLQILQQSSFNMKQIIFDGNALAKRLMDTLRPRISNHGPKLNIINIGDNAASISYIKKKTQLAESLGIRSQVHQFNFNFSKTQNYYQLHQDTQHKVQNLIDKLNIDSQCNGILLQLPLPHHIDPSKLLNRIKPLKDVDCLTQTNRKNLILGAEKATILPCTPAGVLKILDHHNIDVSSKKITLIGRSHLVGMPLAYLLLGRNATLTVCHLGTPPSDVLKYARQCDILISAAGAGQLIKEVKQDAVIIDIGISRKNNKLVGDVSESAKKNSSFYTPVPGGVGPLTVVMLMYNTVRLWQLQQKPQ